MRRKRIGWTNPSVLRFDQDRRDPIRTMVEHARTVVFGAREQGWDGPPYDVLKLAALLQISVEPRPDLRDARTVSEGDRFRIEFNPERSPDRLRYSIAHEIAHTFFPDAADEIQHRLARSEMQEDQWQLELLCNIGAAELLMPIGSFSEELQDQELSIDNLMDLRRRYEVSAEALLIRTVRLATTPCAMFAASTPQDAEPRYRIDYCMGSREWNASSLEGIALPRASAVTECTAIGWTGNGDEEWGHDKVPLHVQCVGIPPYPGHRMPRVVGIIVPSNVKASNANVIQYLRGDATTPRGRGPKILAHVVNDQTPRWGGGFPMVVRNKWPEVQREFRDWVSAAPSRFMLGNAQLSQVSTNLWVLSMVAQHGLGESKQPRIRYAALANSLQRLSNIAGEKKASVHLPTIGCGQAGGQWSVVSELIDDALCRSGISVRVYMLPNQTDVRFSSSQQTLFQ